MKGYRPKGMGPRVGVVNSPTHVEAVIWAQGGVLYSSEKK